MPLDNIQKCAVLLMLLGRHQEHLEDEWNSALRRPITPHLGVVYREKCARERRDALAQTEKRLHKCADNAKLIVVMAAQNELP
ncbi:g9160 [Coccomyxa elongata]